MVGPCAAQCPCDGWVDNLELTPLLFILSTHCFLIQGNNLTINWLPIRQKNVLKIQLLLFRVRGDLKPTLLLLISINYFLIQGHNLKKTVHSLPTTHKQIVPKAKWISLLRIRHHLEPTQLSSITTTICFVIHGDNMKKTSIHYLQNKKGASLK